ncbi:hypothetical protein OsJ_18623 [Oryza sativa Japonica Group]|uniref:Uncharacterized protein n=1 Tax=Oryza sativa subsp. japonica TaxID=39947 RepID=B9FPQ7_ORYSJ|nr:hypothetical protein OsJ_18623 [Oryza sativa Japonica Group]
MEAAVLAVVLFIGVALWSSSSSPAAAAAGTKEELEDGDDQRGEVTYDGRALIVNGTRVMLFSGEIHYARSTPESNITKFD